MIIDSVIYKKKIIIAKEILFFSKMPDVGFRICDPESINTD